MSSTRSRILAASVSLAASLTSLSVSAVVVTGGFSGQIFSGSDFGGGADGFFGAGSDLVDLPITGTFRYDTSQVPPASSTTANSATYSDPTFSTDFLAFSVTINGVTYTLGGLGGPPGIQSIDVIDNTDQLQFDYQRFGTGSQEAIALRFISDIDFLSGTGVPTSFDFTASGIGLTPGGSFSFDLSNGDFASASFSIDTGFAVAQVPEPAIVGTLVPGLLAITAWVRHGGRRRRVRASSAL